MSCSKATDFGHGNLVILDGNNTLVGTVLGVSCRNTVYVDFGFGSVRSYTPEQLTVVGNIQTDKPEIDCLFCYTTREWVQYFVRFWLPPIAMGLAFGYTGLALFGG